MWDEIRNTIHVSVLQIRTLKSTVLKKLKKKAEDKRQVEMRMRRTGTYMGDRK